MLAPVPGVAAIVLGGSRARGTAGPESDSDIGLYYRADRPIDVAALGRAAAALDESDPPAQVTAIGAWGPNIDGGGWLTVGGRAVDLLYRETGRVAATIADCHAGIVHRWYQPGHPHAFVSTIPAGEVALCRPLHDPEGIVAALKAATSPYPPALAAAVLRTFGWEVGFALANAHKAVPRGDGLHVAGCCYRAVACMAQLLYAANGRWLINEKGTTTEIAGFPRRPVAWSDRVAQAMAMLGHGRLAEAITVLEQLAAETAAIAAA